MMIDRKTALVCAALIALMLAAAVTRIMILDDWPRQASLSEALRIWQFFALPFIAAMLVMSRYANGRQATAVEARIEPCCHWGEFLSIDVCLCVLLMQGLQIATSLGPHVPLFAVVAAGAAIVAAESVIVLRAIDQIPKLPWFERRSFLAGKLGPIYGPRFLRVTARIWVVCFIAAIACLFALPIHARPYIPLAFPLVLVGTMALQLHYGRRWKLEQSAPKAEAMNRNQRGLHDTGPETALDRVKEELDQPFLRAGSFSDRIHAALHERRLARLSFRCAGPVSAAPAILARRKVRLVPVTW
jgi:hypothetical protein